MRKVMIDGGDIEDVVGAPLRREEEQPRHVLRDVAVVASTLALACLVAGHAAGRSPLGASPPRNHTKGPRRSLVEMLRQRNAMGSVDAEVDADQEGSRAEPDEGGEVQQPHLATVASSLYEEAPAEPLEAADDLDEAERPFRHGEPCEIGGAHSTVSAPCTFLAVNGDGTYRVQDVRNLRVVPSIDSKFIHRYTPIRDGSDAICTVREGRGFITACTISRGFQNLEGSFFYEVEYDEYAGNEMRASVTELPFGSVERMIEHGIGLERGKKYFLPSEAEPDSRSSAGSHLSLRSPNRF